MKLPTIMVSLFILSVGLARSQTKAVELLWPKGAPNALNTSDSAMPSLTLFPAPLDKANGAAVVICPGGGYSHLATEKEGNQSALWLNSLGVSAYVLKYRLAPSYRHPIEMNDAQRAMRWVRANSQRLKIDVKRVGIMGFSAGGHLASTVATHYDSGKPDAPDPVDRFSCKPDFQILIYPVITFLGTAAHAGSRANLLGKDTSLASYALLSNERYVDANTSPAFLVHGKDDAAVVVANSQMYYDACLKAQVPAQLKIFDHGPHGFGLADGQGGSVRDTILMTWPSIGATWLKERGFLAATTSLTENRNQRQWPMAKVEKKSGQKRFDFLGRIRLLF